MENKENLENKTENIDNSEEITLFSYYRNLTCIASGLLYVLSILSYLGREIYLSKILLVIAFICFIITFYRSFKECFKDIKKNIDKLLLLSFSTIILYCITLYNCMPKTLALMVTALSAVTILVLGLYFSITSKDKN